MIVSRGLSDGEQGSPRYQAYLVGRAFSDGPGVEPKILFKGSKSNDLEDAYASLLDDIANRVSRLLLYRKERDADVQELVNV